MFKEKLIYYIKLMRYIYAIAGLIFFLIGIIFNCVQSNGCHFKEIIIEIVELSLWGIPNLIIFLTVVKGKETGNRFFYSIALGYEIIISLIYTFTQKVAIPRFFSLTLGRNQPGWLIISYYAALIFCFLGVSFLKTSGIKVCAMLAMMQASFVFIWYFANNDVPAIDIYCVSYATMMMHFTVIV